MLAYLGYRNLSVLFHLVSLEDGDKNP